MPAPFLETAPQDLNLEAQEWTVLKEMGVRSFDTLHSVLAAYPELKGAGVRVDELLGRLLATDVKDLLSDAYRKGLDAWRPVQSPGGVELLAGSSGTGGGGGGQQVGLPGLPPGWPSVGRPEKLGADEGIDLLGDVASRWTARDQLGRPTCVGFAAATSLEVARTQHGTKPSELSAIFLYQRIRAQGSDALFSAEGATKLAEARARLAGEGICTEPLWRDDRDPADEPNAAAKQDGKTRRSDAVAFWDIGIFAKRPPNVARTVLDLLHARRPVAVSLPEFSVPNGQFPNATNWWQPGPRSNGVIVTPPHVDRTPPAGHAVCIFAFQPDANERLGGWFIFRNSVGTEWAANAPTGPADDVPFVPDRGYGAITAAYIERHTYEIFAPPRT